MTIDRARTQAWVSATAVGLAGLAMAHAPILGSGFRSMHGELGDTRLVLYVLEHTFQWLAGSPLHPTFWDPPIFYPVRNALAYSDIMVGAAPLYWPWRVVGFAPDTAFQLWLLCVSAANYAAALLLLRRGLRLAPWASAVGAFLFAFALPRLAQSGHFALFPHFPSALCAWALLEAVRAEQPGRRRAWILGAALSAVVQLYAGFYLGWFLGMGAGVLVAWAVVLPAERRALVTFLRASWATLLTAAAVAAAALAPMALGHLAAADEVGGRRFDEVTQMMPRAASWLFPGTESWLYGWTARLPLFASLPEGFANEHVLSLGWLTPLVALAGLALVRRVHGWRLWLFTAVTLFASTLLWPGDFTAWKAVYDWIPAGDVIRAVTRVVLVLLVPVAIGVALSLDRLERSRRAWLAAPVALICMAEQGYRVPAYDKAADRAVVQWVAQQVPRTCRAFYFSPINPSRAWYAWTIDAMAASDQVGIPTVNGYSGNFPPGFPPGWQVEIHQWEDLERARAQIGDHLERTQTRLEPGCFLTPSYPGDRLDAQVVQVDAPAQVHAAEPVPVTVTMRNTGTVAWTVERHFRLGDDTRIWGLHRVELPHAVAPGAEVRIAFTLQAPAVPGPRRFSWRMVHEGLAWFGATTDLSLEVLAPGPARALRAP